MEIIYLIKLNINLKIHLELNKFFLLLEYIKKMNTVTWEQTQNIANNMLKVTDNPDELLMLYLFKLHSLLLDTPVELHPHLAQSLINTGMLNDPVLKNVYGEFLNDEVPDVKQYDGLTHNMPQMLEAHGGHRRSKLNKRKNKSAGNPGSENSNALVPAQKSMTEKSGALVLAPISNLSPEQQSLKELIEEFDNGFGVRAWRLGDLVKAQIVANPMFPRLLREVEQTKKECKEEMDLLIIQRDQRLEQLDAQIEKRKQDIKKKFQSEVNKLYKQIGVDILFWLFGCFIVWALKQNAIFSLVDYAASSLSSPYLMFLVEYIFIAGVIGGLIKSYFVPDYSLALSDIAAESTTKGKALTALKYHNGIHIAKLLAQSSQLPGPEDIFQIPDFIKYVEELEKQKQQVRDHYEGLILRLKDDCKKRLKDLNDQLIILGKDTIDVEMSRQALIGDQPSHNGQQALIGNDNGQQLLLTNTQQPGGMKKQSKKYLKKIRKSRY
jgi:hypothetical protein